MKTTMDLSRVNLSLPCGPALLSVMLLLSAELTAQVMPLDSVLRRVEANNPALESYTRRAGAMDAYAEGARSWEAPMVGAGTFMFPYAGGEARSTSGAAWMFTFEQKIPNPSKQNARRNYLQSRAAVEVQGRAHQFNSLRSEARAVYYGWLVAEEQLKLLKENEAIMELMLKLAEIRYPYNQGSLGNIYKVEGRLAEVRNDMLATRAEIASARARLSALMGLVAEDSLMVDTAMVVRFKPAPVVYDTAMLRERRSDIRQLEAQMETLRLNQQLQRLSARPDFKIRFDHMQPVGNMGPQFSVMGMVSIPIAPWSAAMYKSEARGIGHEIAALEKRRAALLLDARGTLAGLTRAISMAERQLENYRERIIPALQKNYETVMIAYEENREELPMVLDAWEALTMARTEYLVKKETYYMMIVSYEKELDQ